MSEPRRREPRPVLGATLMAIGALLAALCGLCTYTEMASHDEFSSLAPVVGGVPTAAGALLFFVGLFLVLRGRRP